MTGHRLEVADVFHAHQNQFLQRWGHVVSDQQRKVLRDIGRCRTAALGTHLERCDRCSYETVAYDSCRNRHCPKCQSSARDRWLMKQASSLLPVPYAHVVFTVPEQLAPLALRNQRLFYNLLFRSANDLQNKPHPLFNNIGGSTNNAISNYNALQAVVTKRTSYGLQLSVNYTLSHFLDDLDSAGWGAREGFQNYQNAFDGPRGPLLVCDSLNSQERS
jgi:hypothetical protein